MIKSVQFGKESRDELLLGVQAITKAVRVTMGPAGKCVLIGEAVYGNDGMVSLPTIVSKDGYQVTKYFELPNPIQNRGAMMIKEAASETVEKAGDGTTCTCVLAESLITNGIKLINEEGINSQELKRGMDKGLEYVIEELNKMSIPVKGNIERIRQVATVSANNDNIIGDLIAEAFSKIGDEGVIDIEPSQGIKTEIKITDGYKFERGWISPLFQNNRAKEICEFINPLILLYQNKINHNDQISKAVQISIQQQRPLLIISEDCIDAGLAYLAINNYNKKIMVCAVKSPFGENRHEQMEDIALLTGGDYVSDTRGIDITKIELENFGSAKKVIISRTETIIIEGSKSNSAIDDLINDLRMNLTQVKNEAEKHSIEKRIAKLTGKGAVIVVGAATETELNEKLDRVDDAVRATKAAIAEGFVPGGGTAFLRIPYPVIENTSHIKGIRLVFDSLQAPLRQICENAGVNADEIYQQVYKEKGNFGYNVLSGNIEDMVEAGVIDSTKALVCAVRYGGSVAGMLLTSECSIITTS